MIVGLLNGVFSQWFVDAEAVDLPAAYDWIEAAVLERLKPENEGGSGK
jgi:hypothetical protein